MIRTALTIAGSDSGGGAGIQADLKTFSALGAYGMSIITALTAQNTRGVQAVHPVPADFIQAQCDAVFSDIRVDAVKIGMLAQADIIHAVAVALVITSYSIHYTKLYEFSCFLAQPVPDRPSG